MPVRPLFHRATALAAAVACAAVGLIASGTGALAAPAATPAASTVPAVPLKIGTWNTDLQPWLPGHAQVVGALAATDLDVLALQGVWDTPTGNAILADPRIKQKYPYSYFPPAAQQDGSCGAFVPISTQEDFIRSVVDSGVDTHQIEQPPTALPFSTQLLGLDLALTSQPCFQTIVNTLQQQAPGVPPLQAVERASDGTGARWSHGGGAGQLILSRLPLQDVSVTALDTFLTRRVTVNATIAGVRFAFADWPRNVLADADPTLAPLQSGALQPEYAADVLTRGPDVLVGTLNSGPGYQPDAYTALVQGGYAPPVSGPTYCPTATHAGFAPCQVRQRDAITTLPADLAVDNVLVRNTVACTSATTFAAATPLSDHVGASVTCRRPFPATGVLDAFGRPDGAVGGSWTGLTGTAFYRIAGGRLAVQAGGPLLWPAVFGTAQEAYVTLATIAPSGPAQGVLLKVQATSVPDAGAITVAYDAKAKAVRVSALRVGSRSWTAYPAVPVTLAAGDVLGGRALPDGTVEVYRNGALLSSVRLNAADTAFFAGKGGRIGIWTPTSTGAVLDDAGGGTVG